MAHRPKAANIFFPRSPVIELIGSLLTFLLFVLYYPAKLYLGTLGQGLLVTAVVMLLNKLSTKLFWNIYLSLAYWELFDTTLETFGDHFAKAWRADLKARGGALDLQIFVGKDTFSVSILCKIDNGTCTVGSDAETFEQLRMWYAWMQYRRGCGERIIPRQLIRVDRVKTLGPGRILGEFVETYNLGRRGSSQAAFLLNPSQVIGTEMTAKMMQGRDKHGLEFVRAWDRNRLSIIALLPFVVSVVFAVIWIGVSIGKFGVDAQVAAQTAFTIAGFIVTAGALLIALFAFLDNQSG